MMKVLIDTHIALWALMDDPKMPKEAKKILMDEIMKYIIVLCLFGKLR